MRSCTLLNESGDTTIAWDESADDQMKTIIEKKMKEGVTFWLIEPRLGGILPPKKRRSKALEVLKIIGLFPSLMTIF